MGAEERDKRSSKKAHSSGSCEPLGTSIIYVFKEEGAADMKIKKVSGKHGLQKLHYDYATLGIPPRTIRFSWPQCELVLIERVERERLTKGCQPSPIYPVTYLLQG